MPAVNYDYDYYNKRSDRVNKGVAKSARPNSASSKSASQRVSSTKAVASKGNTSRATATKSNVQRKKQNHESIDVPVIVKKKLEIAKPQEMKLKAPKQNTKAKKKVEGAKRSIVATGLAFAMLFIICTRYTKINEMSHEVNSLEKSLGSAIALNQQLSAEVDSKTDLSYIEKYAKYQLGMQKPSDTQIVRIAYEKQDKISTPIVISEEKESSFFDKLLNDLKNLID